MCLFMYVCVYVCKYVCAGMYVCMYVCVCIYMYVGRYVCMYFFIYQLYFTACSITEAILHAWDCLYIICIASYCVYIYTGCIVPLKH